MDSDHSRKLAERVVQAINDRDYSQIDQLAASDVQLRMPPRQVFYGRDGMREFFAMLEARLPTLTLTARKVHAGDGFAVVEYEGVAPTPGGEVDGMGALVLELDGESVQRVQLYVDTAQWEQLQSSQ
ncbi:MAG TPA: nuclear transport factor 2 family protein [Candidatus Dormibacteraeota bacterium]